MHPINPGPPDEVASRRSASGLPTVDHHPAPDRPHEPTTRRARARLLNPPPARRPAPASPLTPAQRAAAVAATLAGVAVVAALLAGAPVELLRWLETGPIVALVAAALATRPAGRLPVGLTVALALSALGDSFLTGFASVHGPVGLFAGIGTFALAYLTLTVAFVSGGPTRADLRVAWPFAAASGLACALVWPFAGGLRPMIVAFALVITAMATSAWRTRATGVLPGRPGRWAGLGGALMLASDWVVTLKIFHPEFLPGPTASDITIRATYLAGWLLILLVVLDPAVRRRGPEASAPRVGRPDATPGAGPGR